MYRERNNGRVSGICASASVGLRAQAKWESRHARPAAHLLLQSVLKLARDGLRKGSGEKSVSGATAPRI